MTSSEIGEIRPQARQQLVAPQDAERAQDAQESERFPDQRGEERDDARDIRPGHRVQEFAQRPVADQEPREHVR